MDSQLKRVCQWVLVESDAPNSVRADAFNVSLAAATVAPGQKPIGQFTVSVDVYEVIACIVRSNQKILAIKALRTITNGGLKECKDAIESMPIVPYPC